MQWDKTLGVTGPAAAAARCAAGGVRDSVVCKNHPLLEVASGNGVYGGTSVALVFGNDQQTCEANTRLIAAAPRMFAVIERGAAAGDDECIAIVEAVYGRS